MIAAMNLTILTPETAPVDSRPILAGIAADVGFVPNLAAATAASPMLLGAFDALRRAVANPALEPVHREIAGLAVGVAIDNTYGVAFHSTMLDMLGVAGHDVDAMRDGVPPSEPLHAAIYEFAREVAVQRGKVADDVFQRAYDAGLTDADLLDLVTECVFAGLVGTIDNLAGRVSLDEFLRPRAWTSAAAVS